MRSALHRRLLACFRALVWALCLAVPLQAAAVAARSSLLTAAPQQAGSAARHETPAAHAAGSDADVHHRHAASASLPPCHQDQDAKQTHQQHKCSSSCAACCIASALPSGATLLPQPCGADVLASTPAWATLSFSGPRLERPPRV